jgi:hypothetical protein
MTCEAPPSGNLAYATSCRRLEAKISSAFTDKIGVGIRGGFPLR